LCSPGSSSLRPLPLHIHTHTSVQAHTHTRVPLLLSSLLSLLALAILK